MRKDPIVKRMGAMFLLPIGIEDNKLRSVPYVTFGIMALCTLIFAVQSQRFSSGQVAGRLNEALDYYARRHFYLEMPAELEEYLQDSGVDERMHERMVAARTDLLKKPENEADIEAEQAHLESLVADADDSAKAKNQYFLDWGYIPSSASFSSIITCLFIHVGFLHLFGNMLYLYLSGPLIEDRLGKVAYPIFYLFGGIFATAMFGVHYPQGEIPLVGASGALAAVMGAFMIKFWRSRICFLFFGFFAFRIIHKTFEMPAWFVLPFWFLTNLLMAKLMDTTGSEGGGVAYWAHVWGFVFGMVIALFLQFTGLENHLYPPETDLTCEEEKLEQEALRYERISNFQKAMDTWKKGVREFPNDLNILQGYMRLARTRRSNNDIVQAGVKLVRLDIQTGEFKMAFIRWNEVLVDVPEANMGAGLVIKIVDGLIAESLYLEASEALEKNIDKVKNPDQLIRMTEQAVKMKDKVGLALIAAAQQLPGCTPANRASLEELRASLERALKPQGLAGGIDLSTPDEGSVPQTLEKVVHSLKVFPVRPQKLDARAIQVLIGGKKTNRIPYDRIKVIGVGVIRKPDSKPELLIDLMLDPIQSVQAEHRILRISSSNIDCRALLPKAPDAKMAFVQLVGGLIRMSGAVVLPTKDAALGKPYATYNSLRAFERETYFDA